MSLEEDERTHREKRPCEDRDRDWGAASTSQEMPRIAGSHQKPEEASKEPLLEPAEGNVGF